MTSNEIVTAASGQLVGWKFMVSSVWMGFVARRLIALPICPGDFLEGIRVRSNRYFGDS